MTYGKLIKIIILIGVAILLLAFSMLSFMLLGAGGGPVNIPTYSTFAIFLLLGLASGAIGIRMIYKDGKSDKKA